MAISPLAFKKKLNNLLQSGKIKAKTRELVLRDEGQVIRKAKENELDFGLRPNLTKIGRYQNQAYALKKNLLNPLAGQGNVDLQLTGATVRGLFPLQRGAGFIFDSNTAYWPNLITRYGNDIASLNQETFNKVQAKEHAPKLAQFINSELGI